VWDDLVVLSAFTDQAYNLILLAEDEARMLGQPVVEPEHVLLALTRRGRVQDLCAARGVTGGDVFAAIVRARGIGDELVLGRVPRSPVTDKALARAVEVAAARGVLGPSSEHLLLALAAEDTGRVAGILEAVGIDDVEALVDSIPGGRRAAVSDEQLKRWLVVLDRGDPPRPGPIPPVFERYTAQARLAVRAAIETASLLENRQVEPVHLMLGCLHVADSVAARALESELMPSELDAVGEAMERTRMYGPPPAYQSTGVFDDASRWVVAERALTYAYRGGHADIGTGHLLLAVLDARDRTIDRLIGLGTVGGGPVLDRLGRSLARALPGDETPSNGARQETIAFHLLIRILTDQFREWLPAGWTILGSARLDGFLLRIPDSRSEADYRIEMGWIVRSDRPGRQRLVEVTHAALASLQHAVCETTHTNWPAATATAVPPEPHAEIGGDDVNPTLRLWYGPGSAPILELAPRLLLNSVLHG
jgi:hypothetical protein